MKLTHNSLTLLGRLLGYPSLDKGGMCRGFSAMLALAILTNEESSFYERLEFIEGYSPDFKRLLQNIEQIRQQVKTDKQKPLSVEDWKKLDVPAFLEGAMVYLRPHDDKTLFNNDYINQEDFKAIYSLVHSKAQENQKISTLLDREWVFDLSGLENWLTDLEKVLSQAKSPVPIALDSSNHSTCFKYNKEKQCWVFTDINDFERFSNEKKYYRELTTKELAQSIFKSFYDDVKGNTVFATTALAINPDKVLVEGLNNLDLKYAITPKQALLYNNNDVSLLYIAAQSGHLDAVNKLIGFGAEINHAKSSGATPLFIASQNGHLDVVRTLLKSGAKVNQANRNGATPLFHACENGHLDVVNKLLEYGAEANQATYDGTTPLDIARQKGQFAVITKILENLATNSYAGKITSSLPKSLQQTSQNHSSFFSNELENDKRFTRSNKPGILYEAHSTCYQISDDVLKSYGFKKGQWERKTMGIDNLVIIKNLESSQTECSSTHNNKGSSFNN